MSQRRTDILAAAQLLLAENGGEFRMRQLADRSGVAVRTLYNLFGGQDAIAGEAILDVFRHNVVQWEDTSGDCLIGRIEQRTESTVVEILRRPSFAKRMVSLYFSPARQSHALEVLHRVPLAANRQALLEFVDAGLLAETVDVDILAEEMLVTQYATIARWAAGKIADGNLEDRLKRLMLGHLAGNLEPAGAALCRDRAALL